MKSFDLKLTALFLMLLVNIGARSAFARTNVAV